MSRPVTASVWWPLACASAAYGQSVAHPAGMLARGYTDRAFAAARLLATVDDDDPVWLRFVADPSAVVRETVCSLSRIAPRALARLLDDAAPPTDVVRERLLAGASRRSLAANVHLDVGVLDRIGRSPDVGAALITNPAWLSAHPVTVDRRKVGCCSVDEWFVPAASSATGSDLAVLGDAGRLLSSWLANPAAPPADVEFVAEHTDSGFRHHYASAFVANPNATTYTLELVADALETSDMWTLRDLVAHPNVSPDRLDEVARATSLPGALAVFGPVRDAALASPNISDELWGRALAALGDPACDMWATAAANPRLPCSDAFAVAAGGAVASRHALRNPNLTATDLDLLRDSLGSPDWWLVVDEQAARHLWAGYTREFPGRHAAAAWRAPHGAPEVEASALGPLLALAAMAASDKAWNPHRVLTAAVLM